MANKQQSFVVYKYLSEILEECRKDMGLCVQLVGVLNEISSSDEMVALVTSIEARSHQSYAKIVDVMNESSETLDALYDFVQLL